MTRYLISYLIICAFAFGLWCLISPYFKKIGKATNKAANKVKQNIKDDGGKL